MLSDKQLLQLQKANYKIIGKNKHSAVKLCLWCRKSIKTGEKDVCYKQLWYGVKSHGCVQMTPSMTKCNLRCLHCWRDHSYFDNDDTDFDDPKSIVDESIEAQRSLLTGLGGVPHDEKTFKDAQNPRNVAISLDGEPTLYPYLSELIQEYHKRGLKTFLVTNGMRPDVIKNLKELPTNLYVSLTSNSEEMFIRTQHPIGVSWKNLIETLKLLLKLKTNKVIRMTLMKDINMNDVKAYADLIKIGQPNFVEVKAYMNVGASQKRLKYETMPSHDEVKEFAEKLSKELGYSIAGEQKPSRVVLLKRP